MYDDLTLDYIATSPRCIFHWALSFGLGFAQLRTSHHIETPVKSQSKSPAKANANKEKKTSAKKLKDYGDGFDEKKNDPDYNYESEFQEV